MFLNVIFSKRKLIMLFEKKLNRTHYTILYIFINISKPFYYNIYFNFNLQTIEKKFDIYTETKIIIRHKILDQKLLR